MRTAVIGLVGISLAAGLAGVGGGPASASPPVTAPPAKQANAASEHDLPSPQADKQRALREEALRRVLTGQSKVQVINGAKVVKLGTKPAGLSPAERARVRRGQPVRARMVDQYVRLDLEQTDRVFVILTEFGNQRAADFPDKDIDPTTTGPSTFEGPLHNAIPEPNRAVDTRTIWQPDYSAAHFRRLYFGTGRGEESLKQYYQRQSSGRYTITGQVTDWVKVPYNEARYGRSNDDPQDANGDDPAVCAGIICDNTWNLLTDAMTQWVADQKAAGRTDAQIKANLASYDQQDRYDYDGDGNFVEPDGYLDRFQVVHSGGDQADGDPYQGEDAIWSHRWYAYYTTYYTNAGVTGPAFNKLGGTEIADTGFWVGDYTVNPENGGRSVIAHEYGHDLGLPDHYDTAGGGDNGVDWWTLMAQSRARARTDVGIGTRAADLGVWDKLQLDWLDYETALAGQRRSYRLGPHEYNSRRPQALVVVLPDKEVPFTIGAPASGAKQWWSGTGDDRDATLTRSVAVPAGSSTLSFQARYDIEAGFDYAAVEVNDGTGFTSVRTSISKSLSNPNGIDGISAGYEPATADLSAYAGKTVQLRFRYVTDGAVAGNDDDPHNDGFFVDDIALRAGTTTVFSDGAESGPNGWTPAGFSIVGSQIVHLYDHFYLASYRAYVSYDRYLRTGPYNFGFPATPNKAEFFPYQNGLLVNYWDSSQTDNNQSQHPGQGLVLPVDANPGPIYNVEGQPWRGRIQVYDAPFSRQRSDSFTLHINGKPSYVRGRPARPVFDDSRSYFSQSLVDANVNVGVKVPNAGVRLRVVRQGATSMTVRLGISRQVSAAATLRSARAGS